MLDTQVILEMVSASPRYVIMNAYEYGIVHDFGERANIINKLTYRVVMRRLRNALNILYRQGKCDRYVYGRGFQYNFTNMIYE